MVAAVGRVGCGGGHGVVDAALDDLGKRRENVSGGAGLEGRSRDRLENGLAPLDAEGRQNGGSERALRGRGECLAHEGGAERGGHGEYGEGGRKGLQGRGGRRIVVVMLVWMLARSAQAIVGQGRTKEPRKAHELSNGRPANHRRLDDVRKRVGPAVDARLSLEAGRRLSGLRKRAGLTYQHRSNTSTPLAILSPSPPHTQWPWHLAGSR